MKPEFVTLKLELYDAVAEVQLNRPQKANALNLSMWQELQSCFEWLDGESTVRAVVLSGNGKHFCSGMDLDVFSDLYDENREPARAAERRRRFVLQLQANLNAMERCRKPVLAAVHNTCIGAGVDMVCACDMRYASEDAYFAIKEIEVGMVADVGTLQRLPRLIAPGLVHELAYTGRVMDADEAREAGFINRVFEDRETLLHEVHAIARRIAARSPLAVRGTKEVLLYSRDHNVADGLDYVATWNAGMLSRADLETGLSKGGGPESESYED